MIKSKRVLIVDDNDLNRKLFEILIGQLYSFDSAKNGLEALSLAETKKFDLILMDIQMPQMDGITAMKQIRQGINSTSPILAVTAFAEESERDSFLEQGFDDFIPKPIRPKEFLQLIQAYLLGNIKTETQSETEASSQVFTLDKKILDQLLKYNSKEAIKKVFDQFLVDCGETEAEIDSYEPNSNPLDLIDSIHAFKGNSGTLGAMGIYFSASRAEEFGRKENYAQFYQEVKKLKNEIRKFREFLKQETIFDI